MTEWFSEDVCNIVTGVHTFYAKFSFCDHVAYVVELYPDMLHVRVEDMVFGKVSHCNIVAV